MAAPTAGPSPLERAIAPHVLLLGAVVSFLACCLTGQVASRHNSFREFSRFHSRLNLLTLYYPTTGQVQALARATLDPHKIVVVVGGNSILLGSGQRGKHLWTRHLQKLLGDDFQVLNLAIPGARTFEFGATAAEILSRDFPRLLLVTNASPGANQLVEDPDGTPNLRYFFWEARGRGLLTPSKRRDDRLREADQRGRDEAFRETQEQLHLDRCLHFRDLWNTVTYRCVSTVWCAALADTWLRPRGVYPDHDWDSPPTEEKHLRAMNGVFMPLLRSWIDGGRPFLPPRGAPGRTPPVSPVEVNCAACLPAPFRRRTLVLINHANPYYVKQLTAEERRDYDDLFPATVRAYALRGVTAVEVGRALSMRDYWDWLHPNEAGGRRLAEEVATQVRGLARRNWADAARGAEQ